MAGNKDRVYWNDSKTNVRKKLGLEDNEDFSKFENICSNAYRFKLSLDPILNWDKLDRSKVAAAQSMIREQCRGGHLKLVDKDEDFNDLIEWKLYQLHKPAHARSTKRQTSIVAAESSAHANQPPASTPNPGSSGDFDPVKAAAKDAARDIE